MRYDVFFSLALSLSGSPDLAPPPQILVGARPVPVAPAQNTAAAALPAPAQTPPGLRVQTMDPASPHVQQTQNTWALRPAAPAMMVFFTEPGAIAEHAAVGAKPPAPQELPHSAPPAVDLASSPGRLLAQQPEILGGPVVPPAIAPQRQAAVPANIYSAASATPDRTPFDYRQVQLRQDHGAWKLTAGSFLLADFGGDEHTARLGLSATQYYRFTEQCQVGAGPDRFSYLLAGGQAPRGTLFGVDGTAFQTERLEVRQVDGRWAVCAGDEPLVKTGENQEDARRVLGVIRKLQCDRLCRLGAADGKGMTFLVRTR